MQNLAPEQLRNLLENKPELPKTATDPAATHAPGAGMPSGVTDAVTGAFKNIGKGINSVVELILLPVLAFYFLIDGRSLRNEFVRFFARRSQQRAILGILRESGEIMRSYLLAQLILAAIAAIFIGGLLGVLGIKYALDSRPRRRRDARHSRDRAAARLHSARDARLGARDADRALRHHRVGAGGVHRDAPL